MDFSVDEHWAVLSRSLALVDKSITRLRQIDGWNFPTDASGVARQLLLDILATLAEPNHVTPMSPPVLFNRLHAIIRLVDIVELSSTDRISWPLVSYCDAMWNNLFGRDGPKIFYSVTRDHNYRITRFSQQVSSYLREVLPAAAVSRVTKNRDLYCLELASSEDDNLPLYANIGHEFGHALFELKRTDLDVKFIERFQELANALFADLRSVAEPPIAAHRFRLLGRVIVRVAEELFCDLVGSLLMGPAFYLSLYEIAWGQDSRKTFSARLTPDGNDVTGYPSMRFRLHCIQKWTNISAFCKEAKPNFTSHGLHDWIDLLELLTTVPTDHTDDELRIRPASAPNQDAVPDRDAIQKVFARRLREIKACLADFLADARQMLRDTYPEFRKPPVQTSDITALLHRLVNNILPNVVPDQSLLGKQASFPDILNASALFRLRILMKGDVQRQPELARQLSLVERLTAKAFEVSYMHKEYNDWRKEHDR